MAEENIFGESNIPAVSPPLPATPEGIKAFLEQAGVFTVDEKSISELETKYSTENIPVNLGDKENYKTVKSALAILRKSKSSVAAQHKTYKAPAWDYCKRLDKIKREATPRVQVLLDAWKKAKDVHDAEQERLAQEEAATEQARVDAIESRIDEIKNLFGNSVGLSAIDLGLALGILEAQPEDFQEFKDLGEAAKEKAIFQLNEYHQTVIAAEAQKKAEAAAEGERQKKEAEDRLQLKKDQDKLASQQEAADLVASVAKFATATSEELNKEIDRVDERYRNAPSDLNDAAVTLITTLKLFLPAAEQREVVARVAEQQKAEAKRLEEEKVAEEERKKKETAAREAEVERQRQDKLNFDLYAEACALAETSLTCATRVKTRSRWKSDWSGAEIVIEVGQPDLLFKVDQFINRQKIAYEEREKVREEAECRRAEDMGQTVGALIDYLNYGERATDTAETLITAIINGEIPFVSWSNQE